MRKLGRNRELLFNILLFGIGSFMPKAVGFFLVPLYTSCMSSEDYGLADLAVSIASLLYPFLSLKVGDAMMAFMYDSNEDRTKVVTNAFAIFAISNITPLLCLVVLRVLFNEMVALDSILFWIPILMVADNLYSFLVNYLRGRGKTVALTVVGLVNSLITLVLNVLLILVLGKGFCGYMVSICGSMFIASIFGFFVSGISDDLKIKVLGNGCDVVKRMLVYSAPLVFSGIAWWLNTSCDRWFISAISGLSENGLYAVALKIPTILSAFQAIFSQAWLLSAFSQKDSSDSSQYSSKVFCFYSLLMGVVCSALILLDKGIASFLFQSEFYGAWSIVPPLLIASYSSALGSFAESLFQTKYDSKNILFAILLGAILNLILNALLVPSFGGLGAAWASAISMSCSLLYRMVLLKTRYAITLDRGVVVQTLFALSFQAFALWLGCQLVQVVCILLLLTVYRRTIFQVAFWVRRFLPGSTPPPSR